MGPGGAVSSCRRGEITVSDERIAYVPGGWDMFHIGHLNILRATKSHCDRLIAGVVSDERAIDAKGKPPIVPLGERLEIVRHITFVDEAVVEDTPEKVAMWERLQFNRIVKGDDWRGTPKGDKLEADFAPLGIDVIYLPYTAHTSSTRLRAILDERLLG
jgi:glycerol-3-phosphate cytidylyltransferase